MAESFKPINTQEEFDNAISERIGRLKSKHEEELKKVSGATAELQKENETLKAGLDSANKSIKEMNDKYSGIDKVIAEKDAVIKKYETESVKIRVATANNLPLDMIDYLKGDSEEQIAESAKFLSSRFTNTHSSPMAGEPVPAQKNDEREALRELAKNIK